MDDGNSTIANYWYKKGYEQALKDAKEKVEELMNRRKPDKADPGAYRREKYER